MRTPACSASRRRRRVAACRSIRAPRLLSRIGPRGPVPDGAVDGPADRWRQRDEHDLGALAAHPQHPVAVFLAEVADVSAGGLEDPQAEQAEHGHQREVVPVRGLAGGGEQGLELQVGEAEGGRLGGHGRAADVLGGECSRTPSMTQVR